MNARKALIVAVATAAAVLGSSAAQAELVPITSYEMTVYAKQLTITLDSIDLTINDQNYATGPLVATLDPAYGLTDNYGLTRFSDGSTLDELHLVVDCPLFAELGIPAQKLHVTEVGGPGTVSASVATIDTENYTPVHISINTPPSGTGVFAPGQFFTDWTYHNWVFWPDDETLKGEPKIAMVKPGYHETTVAVQGTLVSPQNNQIPISGSGTRVIGVPVVPEPSSLLLGSSLAGVALLRTRRRRS
jgi:hypothetical protein